MNIHYKAVLDRIIKKHPRLDFSRLVSDSFVSKYFPIDMFGYELLSEKDQKEFDRRLIVALEDAISVYKKRGIIWFIIVPLAYFLGSLLVELLLYNSIIYEGEFWFYFAWVFWFLYCIFFPIAFGVTNRLNSRALRDFINLDLQSVTYKDNSKISDDLNVKGINYKKNLRELNNLLAEDLISQSEYDEKRKQILDNLTNTKQG